MRFLSISQSVPVTVGYDAVICGGGPAGWVAAVACARSGLRAALIERYGFLGGTATAGLVIPISKFYHQGNRVVGGIAWEFVKKMESCGAAQVELPKGHVSFDPEYYKLLTQRMVLRENVDLYTNAVLSGCVMEGGHITHAVIQNKGGCQAVAGSVFIDATGDADLSRFAGVPMMENHGDLQPMSMCFLLDHVDLDTDLLKGFIHHDGKRGPSVHQEIHAFLSDLKTQGDVPQFGGPWFNTTMNPGQVAVNLTRAAADAADPRQLTRAEIKMREDAFRLLELLRGRYPEFQNSFIAATAVQGGVRETRRIQGAYVLTGEDLMAGTNFPDTIALCAHPMDVHSAKNDSQKVIQLPSPGHIPFRCMYARGFDNLLCAGRTVSADSDAFASLRVQATCMALGEAAGTAAAQMLRENASPQRLNTAKLRRALTENGAVL